MAPNRSSARLRVAVALLVLALAAAACGGGDKKPPPTTVKRTTTTTTPPPPAPLTGVPQPDADKLGRPALMIKVDNTPSGAALQEGVEKADIVFVEMVEGGVTRIAAVYQSQDATVGPVRSARTSDVELAGALNRPLLAYSGANSGVLRQVRSGPLVDAGIDARGATPIYVRNQRGRSSVYRFFVPTAELYEAKGADGAAATPVFQYLAKSEVAPGDAVKGVRVNYGATNVEYEWNPKIGWARIQNGTAHVMANNQKRVAPANVVVLMTPYRDSGFRDVTGARSPQAVLQGSGEAWFLTGGTLLKGTWSRPGPIGPFIFSGAFGIPVKLTPGQTFIELAPGVGSAAVVAQTPS